MKSFWVNWLAFVAAILALGRGVSAGAATIATSQFNIPPFTAGIPVGGQGESDSGWIAPWHKLGGFEDRGHVVTSPAKEGSGAVQLFADRVFGTSIERSWFPIVSGVRVDAYVYVTPGASMDGQIVTGTPATGEIDPRRAGAWRVESNGAITVYDSSQRNFIGTGFHTVPYAWNKYSLIADAATSTYYFEFNDQRFDSPRPLKFMSPMFYVHGINLRALEVLTSYVDDVTVSFVAFGDTNGDLFVDAEDLNNVRNNFGGTGLGDTDEDGDVDLDDLNSVRNHFGISPPPNAVPVPEPAGGALAVLAISWLCATCYRPGKGRFASLTQHR